MAAPRKKATTKPRATTPAKPRPATRRRRPNRPKNLSHSLWPSWRALLLALLLLGSLGALAYLVFLHQPAVNGSQTGTGPGPEQEVTAPLARPDKTSGQDPPPLPPLAEETRPLLALIIDDMGYNQEVEEQLLALDLELTFSLIPFAPHSLEMLPRIRARERAIMLHLPLEAEDDKWNNTPGLLHTGMSAAEIATGLAAALNEVPMATGVNNHMGSRFTADPEAMDHLLAQLPRFDLYFLDSLTTAASIGEQAAAAHGVPFLKRDVFLDHHRQPAEIRRQLARLLQIAHDRGWAVGIGHPYPETLAILQEKQGELQEQVRLVKLEQLVELHGRPD